MEWLFYLFINAKSTQISLANIAELSIQTLPMRNRSCNLNWQFVFACCISSFRGGFVTLFDTEYLARVAWPKAW